MKELLAHEATIEGMRDRENPSREKKIKGIVQNNDKKQEMEKKSGVVTRRHAQLVTSDLTIHQSLADIMWNLSLST